MRLLFEKGDFWLKKRNPSFESEQGGTQPKGSWQGILVFFEGKRVATNDLSLLFLSFYLMLKMSLYLGWMFLP